MQEFETKNPKCRRGGLRTVVSKILSGLVQNILGAFCARQISSGLLQTTYSRLCQSTASCLCKWEPLPDDRSITLQVHMGGCQNYGAFLSTLNIRCRNILGTQKGTIILTTTHICNVNLKLHLCMPFCLSGCIPIPQSTRIPNIGTT